VNKKRAYLNLQQLFDEEHSTFSTAGPWFCFFLLLFFALLFRLSTIIHGAFARCVENDEFWYTPINGHWPLYASLFLVLFLLFVWNALLAIDGWRRSTGNKVLLVANTVAILSMLYVFVPLHDRAHYQFHLRQGYYEDIRFKMPRWAAITFTSENPCVTMERFAGRWRIVDRKLGTRGFDIPVAWIELTTWGRVTTTNAPGLGGYEGRWSPPYRRRYEESRRWRGGWIDIDGSDGPWDFDLQQDTLTLTTTPEYFPERERSTIVMQRVEAE